MRIDYHGPTAKKHNTEAANRGALQKKFFLKFLQYSRESSCVGLSVS